MGILNIGTQALQANLMALQTIGNNIANVNTPGYSRETTVLQAVPGQYTGGGYVGQGVAVQTIQRNYDTFLGTQATLASSVSASDTARSNQMQSLEGLFSGGTSDVGQSISTMLNSFSDVASAPADLTSRTVALTNANETAARIRELSTNIDDLQSGVKQQVAQDITNINTIANNIAQVNADIARAQGAGQPPNSLLDQRDQLIANLNKLVKTTQIPASDGTVSVFVGGSQALVLGTKVSPLAATTDAYSDPTKSALAINQSGTLVPLDSTTLGGGELAGLLQFQNVDLNSARDMLGRLTVATTTAVNNQQALGLDMNGNPGTNLFSPTTFGTLNVLPASANTSGASLGLSISDVTKFEPSDYQVNFTSATTGSVTRLSDGVITAFPQTPATTAPILATVDGLNISLGATSPAPAAGDSFELKPFSTAASNVQTEFSTPRSLAVASPIAVSAGTTNQGSLTVSSLTAQNLATPIDNFSVNFSVTAGVATYNIVDNSTTPASTVVTGQPYVPGTAITYAPTGVAGFSLTLTGAPANNDTMTVAPNPYPSTDGGNATAIANLRDTPMFDGAALTDGYAAAIGQIGAVAQSASYSAQVSSGLASSAQSASSAVSGVNLDEEAANLLQYQQAYQASSKMIQIAQTIFTSLIQDLQ